MASTSSDSPATKAGNTLLQRMMNSDIPKTHFFRLLTVPHIAQPDLSSAITSQEDEDAMEMMPQSFVKEESQDPSNPLSSPAWRPSGAWKWITGIGIRACRNVVTLTCDKKSKLYFGTGTIASEIKTERIQFLCKTWPFDNSKEFVTEVALHKCQMRALAGTYVPTIIGVFAGEGIASLLMELPHQAFWVQASTDMPDVLKKRCVEAYEKLHAAGILHGSPHLRHLLIGGDARVTIMNFERSRVLDPVSNAHIGQGKANAAELRLEMRKVKYQLDYDNARVKEKQKWDRYEASLEHSKVVLREAMDPPPRVPHMLEVLPEDVLDPPIDTRRLKSWAPEQSYSSARFVVPTITAEAFANAVEKFIANIRRLEREGDGPPPSRSPSPAPPGFRSFLDQPLMDQDPKQPSPEKPPAPRRSSRKRKGAADDAESPTKRRKTVVICPPLPITPASSIESAAIESAASPPPKPITVESFIGSSPTISNQDAAIPSDSQTNSTEVLSCEPGPSNLRSALKSPARPTFPMSDNDQVVLSSPITRGKRRREEGAEDLDLEVEASPLKRTRLPSPTKDAKHVSFAPAPDVHLKNYTIPPHLLTKPQKRRHRRSKRWRSSSPHSPMLDTSDAYGTRSHGETKQPWSNFTFAFPPPLGFRFVSHWLKDMIHRVQS